MHGLRNNRLQSIITIAIGALGTAAAGQEFTMSRSSVDGGGAMRSSGGAFELSTTIGQPDSEALLGGEFEMSAGFWFGLPPGDANDDGLVALLDYDQLLACLSGPGGANATPECAVCDLDGNGVVDLVDVADFALEFSGP